MVGSRIWLWSAAAVALAGCAHTDTGQADYRVIGSAAKPAGLARCPGCVKMGNRYRLAGGEEQPIKAGELYSMDIEQMVIGDNVVEGHFFGHSFDDKGEFAILANVFEFASSPADAPARRFLQSNELVREPGNTSDVEMKLIYYGDDIRPRQALNFSNIPLHPRSVYNGGSIGVQLAVLEVDAGSEPMARLLTTLAEFGQKSIPVASKANEVLFDLGGSLFAGGKGDDRVFDYRFVLSTVADDLDGTQALVTPGRYILRRADDRERGMNWDTVYLDPATGRLKGEDGEELRTEMYIVINIRRHPEGTNPEFYSIERWSAVREALAKSDPITTPLTELTKTIEAKLAEERSAEWRKILVNRWSQAESTLHSLEARHITNLADPPIAACEKPRHDLAGRASALAELRVRDALREFRAQYENATKLPEAGQSAEFVEADRNQLVSRVTQYFLPWNDDATQTSFTDDNSFDTLMKDSVSMTTLAIKTAKGRGRVAAGCADLPLAS